MGSTSEADGYFGPQLPSHLYLHVPFCASKCSYCDFASVADAGDALVEAVFRGMRSQLTQWVRMGLEGVLETVYVGGGTPSLVPSKVVGELEFIRTHFPVHVGAEVTVEGNPDSLSTDTVATLAAAGVTRISVGVQSFDDHVLRILGRRHDAQSAWDGCTEVADAGLALSLDLICGVPGQTRASWSETLERAVLTGARHVSVYPLTVEEGTPLHTAVSAELVGEPDADVAADMMVLAEEILGSHSLVRYEVANYAASRDEESRHNTAYWTGRPYIGIGPGAHGMLDGSTARAIGMLDVGDVDAARVRYMNTGDIYAWLVGHGDSIETLTAEESAREDVMLGMRLVRGVPVAQVESTGLSDVLQSLCDDGLVEFADTPRDGQRWRATRRGWLLGNQVFGRIWARD